MMKHNRQPGALTKLVSVILAVTLAVIVGNRLSDEALAVLAGVMCGLGAAIPTSLLILAAGQQRSRWGKQQAQPPTPRETYSPVTVIGPPGAQWQPGGEVAAPPLPITLIRQGSTVIKAIPAPMVEREYNHVR